MNRRDIFVVLLLIAATVAVYSDQNFVPQNINELRTEAYSNAKVIPPRAFTSDGCSLWPDTVLGTSLTDACAKHDIEYWIGGNSVDRKNADIELRDKINQKIPLVGDIMYLGVRMFGGMYIPAPWRWGYGFDYTD